MAILPNGQVLIANGPSAIVHVYDTKKDYTVDVTSIVDGLVTLSIPAGNVENINGERPLHGQVIFR